MQMTMPKPINLPKATAGVFANSEPMATTKGRGLKNVRSGTKIAAPNPFQAAIGKMAMLAPRKY